MKMTFRWFGKDDDTVTLEQIRQIPGMTGIMGFLPYKKAGEVWHKDEIKAYVDEVHAAGLECEVIESVNISEDIKMGPKSSNNNRDVHIKNYIETVRNLAEHGIKVVVYNFMPVFDWLRTDLARVIPEDGSNSLYFDEKELGDMGPLEIVARTVKDSGGFSLPGWEPERLAELESTLEKYKNITPDDLLANFKYFLDAVIPTCEEVGVKLAIHPDDPGWPIFGLPRIAHSKEGFQKIIALNSSKNHALCLCTGSLASNVDNDVPGIIRHFGGQGRVACIHMRNVLHLGHRHFRESPHLSRTGSLDMYEVVKAAFDTCPDVYIRPDHGRMIWGEVGRPGYGLYDRAIGAAYLEGLWEAVDKMNNK